MGRCSYSWEEWNEEKHENVRKHCQEMNWKGSDEFCIFHDPSPEKDADLFRKLVEEQIRTETEKYSFIGYHFPEKWDFFAGKKLEISASFREAIFQDADFGRTTFQDAYFVQATFQGTANFIQATFQGTANFIQATFQDAYFIQATFQDAYFIQATFQDAYFREATFQDTANFWRVTFQDTANFVGATFRDTADLREATFRDTADLREATFQDTANFWRVTFQDTADFGGTTFQDTANFRRVTFKKKVEFVPDIVRRIDFGEAEFLFRSKVTANLGEALYQGVFIENVAFIDCRWPKDYVIYEERHMNDEDVDLSFSQLETIYRDLKQNMQNHGDYVRAGEFYYREMEMRRKGTSRKKINRWWFEMYRFLAGYGEKPYLVVRNSFLVILLAAILFFFCGVARVGTELPSQENPDIISYSLHSLDPSTETLKDFGYCLYYSIVTFTTLGYGDIHPLGYSHILASAEALTGAFFMALFVVVFARKMMR